MKFKELRENESLKIIEVSIHIKKPTLYYEVNKNPGTVELKQIQMRVFTDGEIEKESEEISQNIEEYYIGKRKYRYAVDTLKTKNIYLKNYSYVITYLITKEFLTAGNIKGWHNVVKDISIYLQNPKDKKALKSAKQAIKTIENHNKIVAHSSLFGMLFSKDKGLEKFETKKISENIYSLRKTR